MIHDYDEKRDDDQESINRFENLLKSGENFFLDTDTFDYLIEHFVEKMMFEKALFACDIAISQHPHTTAYLVQKARVLSAKGENKEAIKMIKRAEIIQPNDPEITLAKAYICADLGKYHEAIEYFEQTILFWDEKHEATYQIAICYLQLEDFTKSAKYFKKALRLRPSSKEALSDLVYCLNKLNKKAQIITIYTEFTEQFPEDKQYWYFLGGAYLLDAELDKALEAFQKALDIDPNYPEAIFKQAKIFQAFGLFEKAIEKILPLVKDWNNKDELFLELGRCYESLENFSEAKRFYQKAYLFNDKNYQATVSLGISLERIQKWADAAYYYKIACELSPDAGQCWFALGRMEAQTGNVFAAEQAYEKATTIERNDPEIWKSWAKFYVQQDDYAKAVSVISEAIDEIPNNAELYYYCAVFLIFQRKIKEALHYIEIAVTLNYDKHEIIYDFFDKKDAQIAIFKIIEQFKNQDN